MYDRSRLRRGYLESVRKSGSSHLPLWLLILWLLSSRAQPAQVRSHGKGGFGAIELLLLSVTI
jgi:hypothetical protein